MAVAEQFERDTNGTLADWCRWLPEACAPHPWQARGEQAATVELDGGRLHLDWQALPPRRIALVSLPRLQVRYRFEGVSPEGRERFMTRFDLCMQRGGG